MRVSIDYKDAPAGYRHISKEAASLKLLVEKVGPHFQSTTISQEDYNYGEKVLRDCHSVLEGLNSFIGRYKRLVSMNRRFTCGGLGAKLGKDDIASLQVRLISGTVLFNGFVRRCVVHFINPMDINIEFYSVVSIRRPKHNWLLSWVSTAEFR